MNAPGLVLSVLTALSASIAADTAHALPPTRRMAIVIGNNDGGAGLEPLQYAETDALAMADVLRDNGNFETPIILLGRSAPEILAAIQRANLVSGPGSLLVVYFSGHADADGLRLGQTVLSHETFKGLVADAPVDTVLALVDACHAGILTGAKGGTTEAVKLDVAFLGDRDVHGRAIIAAASATERAHEYPDVGGSLFTASLIRGLLGAADVSGDHQISLREAYEYAYERTRNESALRGAFQRPTYKWSLEGSGDVILTRLPSAGGYIWFDTDAQGQIEVRNARTQRVLAHILPTDPRPFQLHVGPGVYTLHEPLGPRLQRVYTAVVEPGRDSRGWRSTGEYRQSRAGRSKGGTPTVVGAGYQAQTGFAREAGLDHLLRMYAGRSVSSTAPFQAGIGLELGLGLYTRAAPGGAYNGAMSQGVVSVFGEWLPMFVGRVAWQTTVSLGGGLAYQALMASDGDARHLVSLGRTSLATGPTLLFDDWQVGLAGLGTMTAFDREGLTLALGWGGLLQCGFVLGE